MKTGLKSLFVAALVMMFCLPATAFAKPHFNHSRGGHHQQEQVKPKHKHRHHSHSARQCGMSDSQFSNLKSMIYNTTFTSDKLELIKAAAEYNTFTVDQVMQILKMLTFTSDKKDIAVALYDSVCDYNNWYMVYSLFTFSSDIREIKERIGK